MNARNFIYIRKFNKASAKKKADEKLLTKRMLLKNNIPTANLLAAFPNRDSVRSFGWNLPENGFVLKPNRGYGGEGILAFKNWNGIEGETLPGRIYTKGQLESHLFDILDGAYSLQYLPDTAFIEERLKPDPFFKKISSIGLPDIRVIVFSKVPIMAEMRLPTKESEGKANLHLGAIGVGIDIRTGITVYGVLRNKPISFIPGTKIKVRGIKTPLWDKILLLAAQTQAISKLGFAAIDIVIDAKKGPLVLEVNARPGLAIQIANQASLRTRLERLESIEIVTPERGVEVGKSLFATSVSERVDVSPKILSVIEPVTFRVNGSYRTIEAKLDTGAYRTSLDDDLVESLNLTLLPRKIMVKAASGQQLRPAVKIDFELSGKNISTIATIASRSHLQYPLIVGRKDLKGFLINPLISVEKEDKSQDDDNE